MRKHLFIFLLLISLHTFSQVTTWQGPIGFSSEKYYQVKVNGISVPVYDTSIGSYCVFDFTGIANVEVSTMFDVRWVDIRPLKSAIMPKYTNDTTFTFKMSKPENLSVELNGRIREQPLFIFAGRPETDKPSKNDKNVIWFEGGKLYKDVKLELQDNQTVYIEGGAVVQGYIFAQGKKNIKIAGRGILDGSFNQTTEGNKNRFIALKDCENISINDIILHNGTTWQTALTHCNNAKITGLKIVSEGNSDDGMDIVRCSNVVIEGAFIHTKDDCIAIKSCGIYPAEVPTDNILVKNCVIWSSTWGNALEIGFELWSNEVKNIRFENIDIIHNERDGAAMSIHNAGPAHVYNVSYDNIRIEDDVCKLFDIAIFFSRYGIDGSKDENFNEINYLHGTWDNVQKIPKGKEEYHKQFRGTISDIVFKNIQIIGGLLPFSVSYGFDKEKNVSNIQIENLMYMGKKLTDIKSAKISQKNTVGLTIK